RLRLFALLIVVTVYFGPSLRDGHSEELFSLRSLRFSAVEHDLAQFEALKKAVMVEVEGREPCRKPPPRSFPKRLLRPTSPPRLSHSIGESLVPLVLVSGPPVVGFA